MKVLVFNYSLIQYIYIQSLPLLCLCRPLQVMGCILIYGITQLTHYSVVGITLRY